MPTRPFLTEVLERWAYGFSTSTYDGYMSRRYRGRVRII